MAIRKVKQPKTEEVVAPKVHSLQAFKMERWPRSKFKGAPYNPREIDKHAKAKLRDNLKRIGLIEPIVVNRTTGNVVSGHQRLAILDSVEGKGDYELDVAVVELTVGQEKAANISMNNAAIQGDWALDLLGELLKGKEFDPADAGFDALDLELIFNETELAPLMSDGASNEGETRAFDEFEAMRADARSQNEKDAESAEEATEEAEGDDAEMIAEIKRRRKAFQAKTSEERDTEFYTVVVFPSRAEREKFSVMIGKDPSAKYIEGERLMNLLSPGE